MKSLELFSGSGGLAEGMRLSGFKHEALIEWNKDACNSLRNNFKDVLVLESDIRDIDFNQFGNIDILAGGPPCQPFSLGGKAKGNLDDRDMFPYAINGIRELEPKAFLFENVKGLLRQSFSSYFNYIILQLTYPQETKKINENWETHLTRLEKTHTRGNYQGLKYNVVFRLINSANYGVPQKRERVIIVGIKDSLNIEWSFPKESHSIDRLLWDKFVSGDYWDKFNVPINEREEITPKTKSTIDRLKRKYGLFIPELQPWITVREALFDLPNPQSNLNNITDHIFRDGAKIYPGHTGSYIDEPSKTIKAGNHGVPGGENMIRFKNGDVRYFTVQEAKRIQTFPDNYKITGAWSEAMRQLGNAVPVNLAKIIGNEINQKLSSQQGL
jgi:DNA (cytosine-5)-methyltransferase 1